MKEEREILSGIDAPLKKRQGGHNAPPPPGKLGLNWIIYPSTAYGICFHLQFTAVTTKSGELKFLSGAEDSEMEATL